MKKDTLRVRVYNVRFGDAILVSVPDRGPDGETENRHILIDIGNVLSGEGGDDVVFQPVTEDILQVLNNRPLDLYVMTHEHLDHVQGLLYASKKLELKIRARYAWLTASAAPDYYENEEHRDAKKHMREAINIYEATELFLKAAPEAQTPWIRTMMLNNNPRSTNSCVKYLRKIADKTTYVYRGGDLTGSHPFNEARFKIWAPEKDTSVYYGRFRPMTLGVTLGGRPESRPALALPTPPPGVDAGDFYNLINIRRQGYVDNLLAIDKAANNTSIVFSVEWRGWKLLFAGDAERRSWQEMNKRDLLEPVHFLKVSHHGSHTGTPYAELLDKILPRTLPDQRRRRAVVSTYPDTYKDVPDKKLLDKELRPRCDMEYVEKGTVPDGGYRDFNFKA